MSQDEPKTIPPEDRLGFRSYLNATWRDFNAVEHVRKGESGFEIIDTENGANRPVKQNIASPEAAREWMRVNPTGITKGAPGWGKKRMLTVTHLHVILEGVNGLPGR